MSKHFKQDADMPPMVFESPDKGKTVYARHAGENDKELVYTEDKDSGLTLHDLNEIIRMSKTNDSIKDLLDKLKVVYNLSKTHLKKKDEVELWEISWNNDDDENTSCTITEFNRFKT